MSIAKTLNINNLDINDDGNADHVTIQVIQTENQFSIRTSIDLYSEADKASKGFGTLDLDTQHKFYNAYSFNRDWQLNGLKFTDNSLLLLSKCGSAKSISLDKLTSETSSISNSLSDYEGDLEEINGNTCKSEDTGLSPSLVDAVFKRNFASVRKAYQDQVNKDPNLSGTAIVKFTVLADGTVSKANVIESEWNNSELGKLVDAKLEAAFMRMRFPEPKGGETTITYPPIIFQL